MGSFSIFHWIVVLVVLAVPAGVIYVAVSRVRAEAGLMQPGLKGWLFIFATGMWLLPVRLLGEAGKTAQLPDPDLAQFPYLARVDLLILLASLVLSIISLALMMKRSSLFPRAFMAQFAWMVISLPLSLFAGILVLDYVYGVSVSLGAALSSSGSLIGGWIGGLIVNGIWLFYVLRSRRVAMTFAR